MPGLVACGRRWRIGSDDLLVPAFAEMWLRAGWLASIAVVFALHKDQLDPTDGGCQGGELLYIYYLGLLIILPSHLLLDVAIMVVASRGTMSQPSARRLMPAPLYLKLVLHVPELAWTILGTYGGAVTKISDPGGNGADGGELGAVGASLGDIGDFAQGEGCAWAVVWAVRGTAAVGWLVTISLLLGMLVVFDPLGKETLAGTVDHATASKMWERRCRLLCCCAGGEEETNHAFKAVAKLLSEYFQGVDLVATDVAAGLVLLYIEQQRSDARATDIPAISPSSNSSLSSPSNPNSGPSSPLSGVVVTGGGAGGGVGGGAGGVEEWMTIEAAAHYMKFAVATCGWPYYMYTNLCTGACTLLPHCSCCCYGGQEEVLDDNVCRCNTAAIIKITGIKPEDIIYASFQNKVYEIPFFVAIDHERKSVVVAIRGTMSLRDALVDLTATGEEMHVTDLEGGVVDGVCHKGIYMAARHIQDILRNLGVLEKAFRQVPDYQLVLTGHSLGAGAAAILGLLLRPVYPNLHCFTFSPPGGLLSASLQEVSRRFMLSVVLGTDIIPRLSLINMEKLKVAILQTIKNCKLPKHQVFATGCWAAVFGTSSSSSDGESREHLIDEESGRESRSEYGSVNDIAHTPTFKDSLEEAIEQSRRSQANTVDLYPPGHILSINEEEPATSCRGLPSYSAAWSSYECFDQVLVHPKMLSDHMPDAVLEALAQLDDRNVQPRNRPMC